MKRQDIVIVLILLILVAVYVQGIYRDKALDEQKFNELVEQAEEYFAADHHVKASNLYSQALQIKADSDVQGKKNLADRLISSNNAFAQGLNQYELGDYEEAYTSLNQVIREDWDNYRTTQPILKEIETILGEFYRNSAKEMYANENYQLAYSHIGLAMRYEPDTVENYILLGEYYSAYVEENSRIEEEQQQKNEQERAVLEKAEKEKEIRRDLDNMQKYERGEGPIGIAVSVDTAERMQEGFNTYYSKDGSSWFVMVYINARNYGDAPSKVEPGHFTLSAANGYTVIPHKISYTGTNQFQSIDLLPEKHSAGWLIFFMPKAERYVLNFNSSDSLVYKNIVIP